MSFSSSTPPLTSGYFVPGDIVSGTQAPDLRILSPRGLSIRAGLRKRACVFRRLSLDLSCSVFIWTMVSDPGQTRVKTCQCPPGLSQPKLHLTCGYFVPVTKVACTSSRFGFKLEARQLPPPFNWAFPPQTSFDLRILRPGDEVSGCGKVWAKSASKFGVEILGVLYANST